MAVALALAIPVVVGVRAAVQHLAHTPTPVAVASPFGGLVTLNPAPLSTPTVIPVTTEAPAPRPPAHLVSTVTPQTPVVYYASTDQPPGVYRLEAVDWSGSSRGHIDMSGDSPSGDIRPQFAVEPSPDGERLLVARSFVYASDGTFEFTAAMHTDFMSWADDSRSLCGLEADDSETTHWTLAVASAHGVVRHAMHLPLNRTGDASYDLTACSLTADRAVFYRQVDASIPQVTVARISTGKVIFDQSLCDEPVRCNEPPMDAITTADGRHAAESYYSGRVRLHDLVTGRVTAVAQRGVAIALSGDGKRLLVSASVSAPDPDRVALVDVPTGRVLWTRSHAVVQWGDAQVLRGSSAIAAAWRTTPPPPPAEGDGPAPPPASLVMLLPAGDGVRVVTVTSRVATIFASRF
jgi:hypothetical protein